jgi:hypothetical protein
MFTAPSSSFLEWKNALTNIGIKDGHITEELISALSALDLTVTDFNYDSFHGYFSGCSEEEAGITVAKDWAELSTDQEFIGTHVNWHSAWRSLQSLASLFLIKVSPTEWALFMREQDSNK